MSTGLQLQELAQLRLEEAEILFFSGKYDGCVYLCGYVVELALKAIICKHLAVVDYPEGRTGFKVHKADDLKLFAGLSAEVSSLIGNAN